MAQGVAWIGGTGNFNDPSNWSSDPDGNPAGSPATPPGADMDAEYLAAGTVSFAGQSNGEADINNAGMVFNLSGGVYTLSGIGGNQALQFDVGEVESDSPTLTVTGASFLDTEGLNAADAATITVTGGATLDVLGAPTTFLFNQAVVKDGGTFAFDSGLNFTQYSGETANLSVDGSTVNVGTAGGTKNTGATFAGGTTVTVQDKGAINVIGPASFGTGVATFSGGSKLTASSLTVDADSQTSKHASLTLTGSGSNANIAGFAIVGDYGAASLDIDAGAAFQAQSLYVGVNSNSGGTVDLTGAGSSLVVSQTLDVGYLGAGALLASGGSSVTVDGSMTIGQSAGSKGQVTISGAGDSLIVKGNLIVGANGSATLDVSKDATFDVTGEILIGDDNAIDSSADRASSPAAISNEGDVTLNVEKAKLRGPCIIGDNAKGGLTIDANSTLNADKQDVTLGSQKTGNGTLTVDGGGAALSNIKNLIVGSHGAGSVEINSLGAVDAYDLDDGSTSSSSQGTGTITVSFGNLDVADDATIGMYASGSLTVKNKGLVKIGNRLSVDPFGTVTVSSNSGIGVDASAGSNGFVTIGKHGVVDVFGDYSANTMVAGGALFVFSAIAGGYGISFKGAGSVTLGPQVTLSESNKISGFGTGDSITLEGITATDKSYNPSNGALTLEDTGSDVATLYFSGSYTRSNFRLKEVGGSAVVSFNPSKGSAASIQEQIFNSALLSDSLGHHALEAIGARGSAIGSAPPDLWSVGHAPGG